VANERVVMPGCKEDRPMVKLVGHAFLLCCVCFDVDNISNTIGNKVCRNFDVAMFYASHVSFFNVKLWDTHF
jgi:hypothetical protein